MMGHESIADEGEPQDVETDVLLPPDSIIAVPPDRFHLVYCIFTFMGISTLLPWNFFITAKKYFDYKLRNVSLPDDEPFDSLNATTHLQTTFESYLSIASMLANLVFMFLTMVLVRNISINVRMISSLIIIMIIFIITVILVVIDTDSWQFGFFIISVVCAASMVGLTSIITGSMFGLSCLFPPKYTRASMSGQALGGTLSAAAMILALIGGGSAQSSAFGYFLTAAVITLLAVVAYLALWHLEYSKFFLANPEARQLEINKEIPSYQQLVGHREYFSSILNKVKLYCLSVCLIFFVTLACFPGLCSIIKSVNYHPGDTWTDTYFSPVVCFLLFNLGDWIGRTLTHWFHYPRNGQGWKLILLAFLRVVYLPLLMLCNAQPRKHSLPVLLKHDAWPIVLILTLGLSNGYLGTLSMMYGPRNATMQHTAGHVKILAHSKNSHVLEGQGCFRVTKKNPVH